MTESQPIQSQLLEDAFDLSVLKNLQEEADSWYAKINVLSEKMSPFEITQHLPGNVQYLPTASSFSLQLVMSPEMLIMAFSSQLKEKLISMLGPQPLCNASIAWLRRQYPLNHQTAIARPHGWHQDGAYGIDFLGSSALHQRDNSLLSMITVWLPLHNCGATAPGIELINDSPQSLLYPAQLEDDEVKTRYPKQHYWRPQMRPGDALLITGHTIHRTFTTKNMTQFRGCAELRFFPANEIPTRLADHQYINCL